MRPWLSGLMIAAGLSGAAYFIQVSRREEAAVRDLLRGLTLVRTRTKSCDVSLSERQGLLAESQLMSKGSISIAIKSLSLPFTTGTDYRTREREARIAVR